MAAARRTTPTRTGRETRATSRLPDAGDENEVAAVEKPGLGFSDTLVFVTTALIVFAIVLTDYNLGKFFQAGVFFKK